VSDNKKAAEKIAKAVTDSTRCHLARAACKLIVEAYIRGEENEGCVELDDFDLAWEVALEALGLPPDGRVTRQMLEDLP